MSEPRHPPPPDAPELLARKVVLLTCAGASAFATLVLIFVLF
jgi:hypothetical protein